MAEGSQHALPGLDLEEARKAYPPRLRHLVEAASEIEAFDPNGDLAFLHSTLAICGLPYRRPPKDQIEYERRNGKSSLLVSAGKLVNPATGQWEQQGLPFGPKARLIMVHLCSEAVKNQSPEVETGNSLCGFMKTLGIEPRGGPRGSIAPFKEQLQRLIAARMQIARGDAHGMDQLNTQAIRQTRIWWPTDPETGERGIWEQCVRLESEFFQHLMRHAVPLDPRAVAALKGNALALDIYFYLVHRLHRIPAGKPVFLPWHVLHEQFGEGYARLRDFRARFNDALRQALAVYPAARIESGQNGMKLFNSPPPIAKTMVLVEGNRRR